MDKIKHILSTGLLLMVAGTYGCGTKSPMQSQEADLAAPEPSAKFVFAGLAPNNWRPLADRGQVVKIRELKKGRNYIFMDVRTGAFMSWRQFVRKIRAGDYPDYHVRMTKGKPTPVSNPDKSRRNNLG